MDANAARTILELSADQARELVALQPPELHFDSLVAISPEAAQWPYLPQPMQDDAANAPTCGSSQNAGHSAAPARGAAAAPRAGRPRVPRPLARQLGARIASRRAARGALTVGHLDARLDAYGAELVAGGDGKLV